MADRQHDAGSKTEGAGMTDDLVKRLREHVIHLDAWGKEAIPDADLVEEAADRIEKLEAALNCNLPDYDPKIGIVERLRQLGNWRVDGTKSSPIYNKSADHIEKLEAALREIGDCCTLPAQNDFEMREIARKALEGKDD